MINDSSGWKMNLFLLGFFDWAGERDVTDPDQGFFQETPEGFFGFIRPRDGAERNVTTITLLTWGI